MTEADFAGFAREIILEAQAAWDDANTRGMKVVRTPRLTASAAYAILREAKNFGIDVDAIVAESRKP